MEALDISTVPTGRGFPPGATLASETTAHRHVGRLVIVLGGAGVFLLGFVVLLGWLTGSEFLMTVLPGFVRMKANAALAFMAAGAGLAASTQETSLGRKITLLTALLALGLGACTVVEYRTGWDFHLDQMLFHDPVQPVFPGRMAEVTAINFCLAAIALLLLNGRGAARQWSQAPASLIVFSSFAGLIGYLYGVPLLYGSTSYTAMALHTGVGFLVLSTGLLLVPESSILADLLVGGRRGSWVSRRVLPAALLLPGALGWLFLHPTMSLGSPTFGMALFAVTVTAGGTMTLIFVARFINHEERMAAEVAAMREESALRVSRSENELRLITDHLPTLLSYIDPSGVFVRVNQTYETWTGRTAEAIVGHKVRELLGEEYWEVSRSARETALSGHTVTFETNYPTVAGPRHAQITYAPDIDDSGQVRGFACLVLDMQARHQAEAALRQSEKLAAVGRLASSIAHEINNPLEAVTNLLYLAEQDTQGQPGAEYVQQAQQQLARVTLIVTQTLRFHRQSAGPLSCILSEFVEQVLILHHGRLVQSEITVELRYRDNRTIYCRDGEVRQAIANLIGNACDAMSGGGRLLIRTRMASSPITHRPGVMMTIADTGHGIPRATRATLFQPFHTTKGARGSGLGLWITKEIIERHHGTLHVRSRNAEGPTGTVFRIFFADLSV